VHNAYEGSINGFVPPKLPKFDLTTDAECVAISVNVKYVVVNVQQCSLLHGYAIPASRHFSY